MSDKPAQEQDPQLDQELKETEDILADVDSLIAAEDPDFLTKLGSLNIDSNKVNSDAIDGIISVDLAQQNIIAQGFKKAFDFKSNPKVVGSFWTLVVVASVTIYFVWVNQKNLLHEDLFITSFDKIGTASTDYNPNTDTEFFYDNPRFSKNLITMSRLFVNLKASENSGNNPMLILEVTVEGLSTDAIVEIKDRQAEFKDLLARHSEEKNYDELVEAEGKRALTDQFRDLLNANLTRGQVRRVLIKSFIIKP